MAALEPPLVFSTEFDPQTGTPVPVAPGVVRICAPNAGPYTFTGTNTFICGDGPVAVIDPGPEAPEHLDAILAAIGGREIAAIILTHTHLDHCALAPRLRAISGAPLLFGGRHRPSRPLKPFEVNFFSGSAASHLVPDRVIEDGDRLRYGSVTLEVVSTPGHCANHLSFALSSTSTVLVGDHLMGWNSTVVAAPDGNLADYLSSIDTLLARKETRYLPSHGGEIADGPAFARAIRAHRLMRNTQILEILASGPVSLSRLTRLIYPQLTGRVRIGARQTLLAHAEYLAERGEVTLRRGLFGTRIAIA